MKRRLFTEPEIRRVSLAGVVLAMEDIGIDDIENFNFVDQPEKEAFKEAYKTLTILGAIRPGKNGMTDLGKRMAQLPLEPRLARMLLEAEKYGCVADVVTVSAFLSCPNVFARPRDKQYEADVAHMGFKDSRSDALTSLKVWNGYVGSGYNQSWCFNNYLNARALVEISKIRTQLFTILEQSGIIISDSKDEDMIMKSICSGLINNLYKREGHHSYTSVFGDELEDEVFIHPGSSLFGSGAREWFIATQVVKTTKLFARGCTTVKLEWLQEFLPHLFTCSESTVSEYEVGDQYVEVMSQIIFRGQKVGTARREISISEAREIQEKQIAKAEDLGWRKLTFHIEKRTKYEMPSLDYISNEGHDTHSWHSFEEGVPYYCEVMGAYAHPMFRVYEFIEKGGKTTQIEKIVEDDVNAQSTEMKLTFGGSDIVIKTKAK
jgi:HrpA-like RNA helicase